MTFTRRFLLAVAAFGLMAANLLAQNNEISLNVANGKTTLNLPILPGTEEYKIFGTTDLNADFTLFPSTGINGFTWTNAATGPQGFFRVGSVPMASSNLLSALVLNRLAYGPTPDELDRLNTIGAEAYIAEQLAPENISESLDIDRINTSRDWQRVVVTGSATAQDFYIYLTSVGDAYIDDIKLVPGSNPDVGTSVLKNGDFETALAGTWNVQTNLTNSVITTDAHTGSGALHIISSYPGSSKDSSISQTSSAVVGQTYTLSFWYKPGTNLFNGTTLRFSNNGIVASPDTIPARLASSLGSTDDLRAWHILHAVRSKKQLQEILLQFLENHFVTQVSKTRDYFDGIYNGEEDGRAARTEYMENVRWRQALNSPTCTFSNLLTISCESPAMIVYLDTVDSRGDGSNIPNENFARELLELFTFGVDNGYDQTDITLMSHPWSGWSLDIVDATNEFNPLAPRSTTLRPGGTNVNNVENLQGVWAFNYKNNHHWNQGSTIIFPGKKAPDRFGPPYAGRDYTLGVDVDPNTATNWQRVTMTGTATSTTLYMYLSGPGDIYLDDLTIVAGSNPDSGSNLLANGGFESGLTGWTVSLNHANSVVETGGAHGGAQALHMIATEGGSTRDSSIYRSVSLTSGSTYSLSFWWRPGNATGSSVTLRLSGSSSGTGIFATAPQRLPGSGLQEGYRVIAHLANQPFTQEFISVKLCRLFVHDNFQHGVYDYTDPNLSAEGRLVKDCMAAWENNLPKGQIRKVLQTIFNSDLFRSQAAARHKVKTPLEFTVSAIRALRSENTDGTATVKTDGKLSDAIIRMGAMRLFDRAEPDGYPEVAAPWISAGTLAERLRWVQSLCMPSNSAGRDDVGPGTTTDLVGLIKKKLPSNQWNNAGAIADYFLNLLMPGEGKANVDLYRTAAMNYLNSNAAGVSNPFSGVSITGIEYDARVRGMVAALMTSQRFHEQ